LLGPGNQEERLQPASKLELAHRLLSALGALLRPPADGAQPDPPPGADP
jgi:hypothetical protein